MQKRVWVALASVLLCAVGPASSGVAAQAKPDLRARADQNGQFVDSHVDEALDYRSIPKNLPWTTAQLKAAQSNIDFVTARATGRLRGVKGAVAIRASWATPKFIIKAVSDYPEFQTTGRLKKLTWIDTNGKSIASSNYPFESWAPYSTIQLPLGTCRLEAWQLLKPTTWWTPSCELQRPAPATYLRASLIQDLNFAMCSQCLFEDVRGGISYALENKIPYKIANERVTFAKGIDSQGTTWLPLHGIRSGTTYDLVIDVQANHADFTQHELPLSQRMKLAYFPNGIRVDYPTFYDPCATNLQFSPCHPSTKGQK